MSSDRNTGFLALEFFQDFLKRGCWIAICSYWPSDHEIVRAGADCLARSGYSFLVSCFGVRGPDTWRNNSDRVSELGAQCRRFSGAGHEALDAASQALVDLAGDIEMEQAVMDERDDDDDDDRGEGWVDQSDGMSQEDQDELDLAVHPVRFVLIKINSLFNLRSNFKL